MDSSELETLGRDGRDGQNGLLPEGELARVLGISRRDLKNLRGALLEDRDWVRCEKSGAILITQAGQIALDGLLKKNGGRDVVPEGIAAARCGRAYRVLEVVRLVGPRMLLACEKEAAAWAGMRWVGRPDELRRVLVRASTNFCPKMTLEKCCASSSSPGVFHYHGRYPRSKGRF